MKAFRAALLLAAVCLAGCSSATPPDPVVFALPSGTAPTPRAVPPGERAVDALGLEILVPDTLALDPPCQANSVSRPGSGLTYAIGCIPTAPPVIAIVSAADAAAGYGSMLEATCAGHPVLDDESGCLQNVPLPDHEAAGWITSVASWPGHDVAIVVLSAAQDTGLARSVIASARWTPVDRNGCAARRSPVATAAQPAGDAGAVLPDDATSVSVCWYQQARLAASALVTGTDNLAELRTPGAVENAPGIGSPPPYQRDTGDRTCSDLDTTEGVVFLAHTPGRPDNVSVAQLAACRQGQLWTDGTRWRPADEPLASALRRLTGFLIVFGYRVSG